MDSWYPVRLSGVEKEAAYLTFAKKEEDGIKYFDMDVPISKVGNVKPEAMGEIAFYGEAYLVKFHEGGKWVQTPELDAVRKMAWSHIIKSEEKMNERIKKELDLYGQETGFSV
jgi:hypothetical protein